MNNALRSVRGCVIPVASILNLGIAATTYIQSRHSADGINIVPCLKVCTEGTDFVRSSPAESGDVNDAVVQGGGVDRAVVQPQIAAQLLPLSSTLDFYTRYASERTVENSFINGIIRLQNGNWSVQKKII